MPFFCVGFRLVVLWDVADLSAPGWDTTNERPLAACADETRPGQLTFVSILLFRHGPRQVMLFSADEQPISHLLYHVQRHTKDVLEGLPGRRICDVQAQ